MSSERGGLTGSSSFPLSSDELSSSSISMIWGSGSTAFPLPFTSVAESDVGVSVGMLVPFGSAIVPRGVGGELKDDEDGDAESKPGRDSVCL